jgi:hypothetical protein
MSTPVKKFLLQVDSPTHIQPETTPALAGYRPKNTIACFPHNPDGGDVKELSSPPLSIVTRRLQHNVTFASERESISPVTFEHDFYGMKDQSKVGGFETDSRRGMSSIG